MSDLQELAERCEAATAEQQRECIEAAYEAMFGHPPAHEYRQPDGERGTRVLRLLDYGGFLDAAMTLVPEGWVIRDMSDWTGEVGAGNGWSVALLRPPTIKQQHVEGEAATPALALCAASLRAREEDRG